MIFMTFNNYIHQAARSMAAVTSKLIAPPVMHDLLCFDPEYSVLINESC